MKTAIAMIILGLTIFHGGAAAIDTALGSETQTVSYGSESR